MRRSVSSSRSGSDSRGSGLNYIPRRLALSASADLNESEHTRRTVEPTPLIFLGLPITVA